MTNIHLVTLFSRHQLLPILVSFYHPMNIIWHLVQFQNEKLVESTEDWIKSLIVPKDFSSDLMIHAMNYFIRNTEMIDEDYYVAVPDDDMYESNVIDKIKQLSDDIVVISMKRGDHIPHDGLVRHRTTTLYACPENMRVRGVGSEQIFVKGKIFRKCFFAESHYAADGMMAKYLKKNYPIRYEPELFVLFNYFQPGRWNEIAIKEEK